VWLLVLLACQDKAWPLAQGAMGSSALPDEAQAQVLLDHEKQGWAERRGLDEDLRITILPYGAEAGNHSVRAYWRTSDVIPSAKLTLAVEWLGARPVPALEPPLSLRLLFHHRTNSDLQADLRVPFDSEFTVNVGAGSNGHVLVQAALFDAAGRLVALASRQATIRPLLLGAASQGAACEALHGLRSSSLLEGPPVAPPGELLDRFTMQGTADLWHWYFDDLSDPDKSYRRYSEDTIAGFIQGAEMRKEFYYGSTDTWLYQALDMFPVRDRRVLIVGSNMPIYESICLAAGAALCVTLEYNQLRYEHPRIHSFTVEEWEASRRRGDNCDWDKLQVANCRFDSVWSISSFEHDGLGRYGDPIDPDADLRAMLKLREYLAPDGELLVAVPVGPDAVFWNEGRVYGRRRLPLLLQSYTLAASFGVSMEQVLAENFPWKDRLEADPSNHQTQPVFVLRQTVRTGSTGRGASMMMESGRGATSSRNVGIFGVLPQAGGGGGGGKKEAEVRHGEL